MSMFFDLREHTTPDGTRVVFLMEPNPKDGPEPLAVFPDLWERGLVQVYARLGQHAFACPDYIENLREATAAEAADLQNEIDGIYRIREEA